MHAFSGASKYIEAIRNSTKKRYAKDYYQYLRSRGESPEPDRGPLSVMAAQAVRMQLLDLLEPAGYGDPNVEPANLTENRCEGMLRHEALIREALEDEECEREEAPHAHA